MVVRKKGLESKVKSKIGLKGRERKEIKKGVIGWNKVWRVLAYPNECVS